VERDRIALFADAIPQAERILPALVNAAITV
jgi:hypothetical protein